ncbi:MAG TPA: hypothetical protein DDY13_14020 [Cytophagales bacterium]|nr:hypothetical protein [Cytophagales bacterium]
MRPTNTRCRWGNLTKQKKPLKIKKKMKKLSAILLLSVMSTVAFAQNDVITKLFDKYYDDENFTKVSVTSKMFELFTEVEPGDEDEKEILEAISKLKGLKVLVADSIGNSRQLFDQSVKDVKKAGYEELMQVKDAKEDLEFLISESDGIIDELVMIVGGHKQFVILSLFGEIDLKQMSKLSKSMRVTGMKYLENISDEEQGDKSKEKQESQED